MLFKHILRKMYTSHKTFYLFIKIGGYNRVFYRSLYRVFLSSRRLLFFLNEQGTQVSAMVKKRYNFFTPSY